MTLRKRFILKELLKQMHFQKRIGNPEPGKRQMLTGVPGPDYIWFPTRR
jgi:hypothetical protein